MVKLKNQFKIISICLFMFLGLLFINNNHQVMARRNNDNLSQNNEHNNVNHINVNNNLQIQNRIWQNLNSQRNEIIQQIANARNTHASEEIIGGLFDQIRRLNEQILDQTIILHNAAMPQGNNLNQQNNPGRR